MTPAKTNLRTCPQRHASHKSSDCPTCPVWEQQRKPLDGFLSVIAAPARRALVHEGIKTLQHLSPCEAELLTWHGFGPSAMFKLQKALSEKGLSGRKNKCVCFV